MADRRACLPCVSSTTRKRVQATIYAKVGKADVASTLIEAQMGMVDRGADIGFASQFPGYVARSTTAAPPLARRR